MDSVLDFLFLRRLRLNYITPPICPIPIASASGLSIPVQSICPLLCPAAPTAVTVPGNHFLVWDIEPLAPVCCTNVVCYNLYQQFGDGFVAVSECQQPNTLVVCDAATWTVSAIFSTGVETAPTGPFVSDGITPLTIPLPFAEGVVAYRVTKDGVTVLLQFFSAGYQVCNVPVCYSVSQITSDGETCLSDSTCFMAPPPVPPTNTLSDVAAYWKLNDPANGTRFDSVGTNNLLDVFGNEGQGPGLVYPQGVSEVDVALAQNLLAADSAILGMGPGVSISFSLWVNNTFNLSIGRPIFAKATNYPGVGEYLLMVDALTGNVAFRGLAAPNDWRSVDSGVALGSGVWHHVACGFDSALQEVWIQVDSSPMVTAPCNDITRTAQSLSLSNFSDSSFRGLGSFSGMGLWKRRLTGAEITQLINGGVGYPLSNFYP